VSAPGTRRRLLDAAARVIRAVGPGALTLEAVAREAGVSKGGLLYHFATKEALVDALVADWLDRFEAEIADRAAERGWARAYAEACLASSADERATDVAVLAALVGDPARLEPVRRRYAAWQERLAADGGDVAGATIVRLAADGLWLADLIGLAPPEGDLRREVMARLAEGADDHRRPRRPSTRAPRTSS
jgi:AcrR family transcriptional regulator